MSQDAIGIIFPLDPLAPGPFTVPGPATAILAGIAGLFLVRRPRRSRL